MDQLHVKTLKTVIGNGEHGPHSIELSPDRKSMYMVFGNHTDIPSDVHGRVPEVWGEDNLLPVIKDPSGHANSRKAPGGWVAQTDFEGNDWTLIAVGTRNTFDIAFNRDNELFGFDSDMEYDLGMPWYRPIRLNHVTSGADFGWRTGTGKFRDYYPDNLSGIVNLGQGSPTGLLDGSGLKFPAYYQNGLYLFDWSYGTMYHAKLNPKGSSFETEVTEFISGVPLPLTNGIVGDDGALYFLTGGRRLESGLYRVTYEGELKSEVLELEERSKGKKDRELRHELERLHISPNPCSKSLWNHCMVDLSCSLPPHEFRYRNPVINKGDIVIPISQSGETADTLAAIKMAKSKGAFLYGICNVVGSSIARETHTGIYTHAGSEIGVASTKAFSCQICLFLLMGLALGEKLGTIDNKRYNRVLKELYQLPKTIEKVLKSNPLIEGISENYLEAQNFLYLGRGYHFPIALEGALKLKEISYIHAEGYPAAEMKHGPIALIDENMPVVVIATRKGNYHKVVSNIMEIKARGGKIIAVVSEGDEEIEQLADHIIEIPDCHELIAPIIANIPLQLLSYHIANKKGCDIDQPRNLAKSVTVE